MRSKEAAQSLYERNGSSYRHAVDVVQGRLAARTPFRCRVMRYCSAYLAPFGARLVLLEVVAVGWIHGLARNARRSGGAFFVRP